MADDIFTSHVYDKSVSVLKKGKWLIDGALWSKIETGAKDLLAATGPVAAKADVLDKLREKLVSTVELGIHLGRALSEPPTRVSDAQALAEGMLFMCRAPAPGFQERVALLKFLKHFYFVRRTGGQEVWVVDGPTAYPKWTFDLFAGKSEKQLKELLQQDTEVFGGDKRSLLADGLQQALVWSQKVVQLLTSPAPKTLALVKKWFELETADDSHVRLTADLLRDQFKQIADSCSAACIIFADWPAVRFSRGPKAVAEVKDKEKLSVIYVEDFFGAAKSFELGSRPQLELPGIFTFLTGSKPPPIIALPELWECALMIIHELSHMKLKTLDYAYVGLKPVRGGFDAAFITAQSYTIFAAEMVGAVSADIIRPFYEGLPTPSPPARPQNATP